MTATKVNVIRNLLQDAPFICGCDEPERVSFVLTTMFDVTAKGKNVFDVSDLDIAVPDNRFKLFDLRSEIYGAKDLLAARKIMALLITNMWSGWKRKNKVDPSTADTVIEAYRADAQIENKEVDALLSYNAALMEWWIPG